MTQDNESGKGSLREDQARPMFSEGFSFSGYERDVLFLRDGANTSISPARPGWTP